MRLLHLQQHRDHTLNGAGAPRGCGQIAAYRCKAASMMRGDAKLFDRRAVLFGAIAHIGGPPVPRMALVKIDHQQITAMFGNDGRSGNAQARRVTAHNASRRHGGWRHLVAVNQRLRRGIVTKADHPY